MKEGSTSAPIALGNKVVVLGVQQRPDLLETLTPRVETGDDVLYVVVHNLMVDLDIVELQHNLIAQAARGIAVMIVLLEIEVLETALTEECQWRLLKLGNQMQSVPVDVRVKANSMLKAKTMTSTPGEAHSVGRVKAAPKRVSSKYRQGTFLQRSQMKPFGRTANARGQPHMVQHPDPT